MHNKKALVVIIISLVSIVLIATGTLLVLANTPANRTKAKQQQASKLIDQALDYINQNKTSQAKDAATKALTMYTELGDKWQIINAESIIKTIEIAGKSDATGSFTEATIRPTE